MTNTSSAQSGDSSWEPITAVQVIAHRVARRRVFLICAGIWSLAALVFATAALTAGAAAAGGVLIGAAIVIALIAAVCAAVWKRRPIPSPKHLYPMMLPHTPALGWSLFGALAVVWILLCVSTGAATASLAYAAIMFASVPLLLGCVVLVPGLVMSSRKQQLRSLLDRSPPARQQLDELAATWTNPNGRQPFGQM